MTEEAPIEKPKPSATKKVRKVLKMKTKKDKIRVAAATTAIIVVIVVIVVAIVFGTRKDEDDPQEPTTTEVPSTTPSPSNPFRLPTHLKPLEYWVRLRPFLDTFDIEGHVQLEMEVLRATRTITLHMLDIVTHNETTKVSTRPSPEGPEREVEVTLQEYDLEREFYMVHLKEELQEGHLVVLSVSFTAYLNDQLKGFYRSSYTLGNDTRWLAVTQFSPDDARMAFPCMDEPALKAVFTVTLGRQEHMTSVSNMPLSQTTPMEGEEGWVWDHFQPSLRMSTYLVAILVSDFKNIMEGNFAVWSREEVLEQSRRSLEVGPPILEYFADYFNISYPLPKTDMAAIPDFAFGAMENWGLITYREEDMLLPEGSTAAGEQRVVVVVAHELSHMWFGNLVTPSWWTDIWLNEGFASFLEYYGVNHVEPEWAMLQQMALTMQEVMVGDGLPSTHPVSQPVEHPDEIGQIFDDIAYSKGMSVIRMMNHFLTEDTFKRGLTNYLNHFAYDSATQDDLWEFLTKAAQEDDRLPQNTTVKDIMDTWTLQSGYPVVTVTRGENGTTATLTQKHFQLLTGDSCNCSCSCSWWVPLSYTTANDLDFTDTSPSSWIPGGETSVEVKGLPGKDKWVIFNLQATGYYRVNYDKENWDLIVASMGSDVEVATRAQVVDDALSLARAGLLSYDTPLSLLSYLVEEVEFVPWSAALSGLSYLEQMLTRKAAYGDLKRYLLELVGPLYVSVGFEDTADDAHLLQHTRSLAVAWACKLGHEECVSTARSLFDSWMADENVAISPNTKTTVYCEGVAKGGEEAWEGVWARYLQTEVASEKTHLLRALGCSKEMWLLQRYLNMAFTEGSGIRKQNIDLVFGSVASNDASRTMAWRYLRDNVEMIVDYYESPSSVGRLITSATAEFNTPTEKQELETFVEEHKVILSLATRSVQLALEKTDGNIAWMENSYDEIKGWLEGHLKN